MINDFVSDNNRYSKKDLTLIESKDFQNNLEKTFYNSLIKELDNYIIYNYNNIGSIDVFTWKSMDNLVPNNDPSEYTFYNYIQDLDLGKFRDNFFLGLNKFRGEIKVHKKNYYKEPNGLFVGSMGSGKSYANFISCFTWLLSNSDQSLVYIVDVAKGANDYSELFSIPQVRKITEKETFLNLIDDLYDEVLARNILFNENHVESLFEYESKTKNKVTRILVSIDEFQDISYPLLNFDQNYKKEGTSAHKYLTLMRVGRSMGIWFNACSSKATQTDIPVELIGNFTQKQIFRVSKAEATYLLADVKASEIKTYQKGRCETDYGTMQFPYISPHIIQSLIRKYIKPIKSKCSFIKQDK